jgi:uncharacterized protein YkwD
MSRSLRGSAALAAMIGALSVASLTVGAGAASQLDDAAQVVRPAQRVAVPDDPGPTSEQDAALELLAIVNLDRSRRNLPEFEWHEQLVAVATGHSSDMAAHEQIRHAGSDGSNGEVRLKRAGFAVTAWGENIAVGFVDPQPLFAAWLDSPQHRSQLIGDFRFVGIASVASDSGTPYWTLIVAS